MKDELTTEEIQASIKMFQDLLDAVDNATATFNIPPPEGFEPIRAVFQKLIDKGHFTKSELKEATRLIERMGLGGLMDTSGQDN